MSRNYTIASIDYLVIELGSSEILRAAEPQDVYWTNDLEALIYYIDRLGGKIDSRYENVEGRIVVKY